MNEGEKTIIVLEGCLGDWSKKSYIGNLTKITERSKSKIELYTVDIRDIGECEDEIREYVENITSIQFINKKSNNSAYNEIPNADFVFIATPHEDHCDIAEHWLKGRLKDKGIIFIEKPLDSSVKRIKGLEGTYGRKTLNRKIFVIDHYIPKIVPLLNKLKEKKGEYGKIKRIRFNILESDPIPQSREKTLKEGLILDMFPHILAVFTRIMETYSDDSFKLKASNFQVIEVKTGRYTCSKIEGETFAKIVIKTHDITIESYIGKAVGSRDHKKMEVFLEKEISLNKETCLERYTIRVDFVSGEYTISKEDGIIPEEDNIQKEPIKALLNNIFSGKNFQNQCLSFSTGFEVVKTISKIRENMCKKVEYEYERFDPPNRILMSDRNLDDRDKKFIDVLVNQYNFLREEIVRCIYLEHAAIIGLYTAFGLAVATLIGKIMDPHFSFSLLIENPVFLFLLILAQVVINSFGSLFLKEQARNRRACSFLRALEYLISEKIGEICIYWENYITCPLIDKKIDFLQYFKFRIPINCQYYKNRLLGVGIPIYLPNFLITSSMAFLLCRGFEIGIFIFIIFMVLYGAVMVPSVKNPIFFPWYSFSAAIVTIIAVAIGLIFHTMAKDELIYVTFFTLSAVITTFWASMIIYETSLPLKKDVTPTREEVLEWLEEENLGLLWR
jgi:predicted dehydrogenase